MEEPKRELLSEREKKGGNAREKQKAEELAQKVVKCRGFYWTTETAV